MPYIANAALVVVKRKSGADFYAYFGSPLPDDAKSEAVAGLLAEGLVIETGSADGVLRPAESGPGSAKDKWLAYAEAFDVDVDADASKEDIIAAVTEAGH